MPKLDTSKLPVMPEQIRCIFNSDYSIRSVNPIQSNTSIAGNVRTRNRWRNIYQTVSLTYQFDDTQAQIFEGFIRWEANNGAGPFIQYLCFPGDLTPQPYVVRWTQIYDGASWVAGSLEDWQYTVTAVTLKDERPSQEQYALLALLGYDSYDDALAAIGTLTPHWDPQYWDRAVGMVGESVPNSLAHMDNLTNHWVPQEAG